MLTVSQCAERLGITPDRVRKLIIAGALKAERLGPMYTVDETDLEAFARLERPRGKRRAVPA